MIFSNTASESINCCNLYEEQFSNIKIKSAHTHWPINSSSSSYRYNLTCAKCPQYNVVLVKAGWERGSKYITRENWLNKLQYNVQLCSHKKRISQFQLYLYSYEMTSRTWVERTRYRMREKQNELYIKGGKLWGWRSGEGVLSFLWCPFL